MPQAKDIKSVKELQEYFSKPEKAVDYLTDQVQFFEMKSVFNTSFALNYLHKVSRFEHPSYLGLFPSIFPGTDHLTIRFSIYQFLLLQRNYGPLAIVLDFRQLGPKYLTYMIYLGSLHLRIGISSILHYNDLNNSFACISAPQTKASFM